jgi:hypothetical protein
MAKAQSAINLAELLQDLHDSEISRTLDWLYDSAWHAEIGKPPHAAADFDTGAEAVEWLRATAIRLYPDSPFAKKHRRGFE